MDIDKPNSPVVHTTHLYNYQYTNMPEWHLLSWLSYWTKWF
jgi:hypothetical protein